MKFIFSLLLSVFLLLPVGCARVPTHHYTVEDNGQTCSVNTRCLCEDSSLTESYLPLPADNGLDPERIVLLNWNVHKETSGQWRAQLERLINGVDLLTLQEGTLSRALRDTLRDGFSWGWILANAFTLSGLSTGVVTASQVRPDFFCSSRLAEPVILLPKTVLITRYPVTGTRKTLLLVNMHMVNFSLATTSYRKQLANIFSLINTHRGPMIISGDFNSWSDERMAIVQQFAGALGAKETVFTVDDRTTFFGHTLDHVFYRGLEQVNDAVFPVQVSDHNPMRVTFRLPADRFAWSTSDE
jgi:endonuclease/exonuclease/phosphatase (EEP) superfamily protein YafD